MFRSCITCQSVVQEKEVEDTGNNTVPCDASRPLSLSPAAVETKTPTAISNRTCSTPDGSPASPISPAVSAVGDDPQLLELRRGIRKVVLDAHKLRAAGRPYEAERELYTLVHALKASGSEEDGEALRIVRSTLIYQDIAGLMEECNNGLQALLDDTGWTIQKEADKIRVWTRHEPDTDLVTVRVAGLVEGPFANFCAIGKEVPLLKTWMPGVKTSTILKEHSPFEFVGYYCWKFPLVSAREFLVEEETMINDINGYCIVRRRPPTPREDLALPPVQKHHIRAAITNWVSFTCPIGEAHGKNYNFVVTVMNVDLKIPMPKRLVNYLSINVGYGTFQQLRHNVKKSMDPSHPLYQSVNDPANAAYYDRMRSLEAASKRRNISSFEEIVQTGWVKDPGERRKLFARNDDVLVPMV